MTDKRIRIILDSKQAEKDAHDLDEAVKDIGESADKSQFSVKKLASAIAAAIATAKVIEYADTWNKVENQLRRTTSSQEDLIKSSYDLLQIANQTKTGILETTELYTSLNVSTQSLGYSQEQLKNVTKTINNLFLESGKSAAESAGAILQLSQALQSGTLRGDEFNSIAEGAPGILTAVTKHLKMARSELKDFASEGKITSKVLVDSLLSYSNAAQQAADRTEYTFEQARTVAANNIAYFVGQMDNLTDATGVLSEGLVRITSILGDDAFIQTAIAAFEALSLVIGSRLVAAFATATTAQAQKIASTIAALKSEQDLAFGIARRADAEKAAAMASLAAAKADLDAANAKVMLLRQTGAQTQSIGALVAALDVQAVAQARVAAATETAAVAASTATAANARLTAATAAVTSATSAAGIAMRGLQSVMNLLGGPVGVITLAAGALVYYIAKARETVDANELLARSVEDLSIKQAKAAIVETTKVLDAQRKEVEKLEKELRRISRMDYLESLNRKPNAVLLQVYQDEIAILDAKMEKATSTVKKLQDRLKTLGDIVNPQKDPNDNFGFSEDIGDPFAVKTDKRGNIAGDEFLADMDKLRENTRQIVAELNLRKELAKIYRQEEIDGAKSDYEKQRVIIKQNEAAKIAELNSSFAIEEQARKTAQEKMLANTEYDEVRRNLIIEEFQKQSIAAKQIYEDELLRIQREASEARKEIDLKESQAANRIAEYQNVTKALEMELALRKQIREQYQQEEIDSEFYKYEIMRNAQMQEEAMEKARILSNYETAKADRLLQFEQTLAQMEYENEEKRLLQEEFDAQEKLRKEILETELSAIEEEGAKKRTEIARMERDARLQMAMQAGNNLMAIAQGHNKKAFELGKKSAIASAGIQGVLSAINAWRSGMETSGPWAPVVAAGYTAASLLKTGALIQQLSNQQFNGGAVSAPAGGVSLPSVNPNNAAQVGNSYSNVSGLPGDNRAPPTYGTLVVEGIEEDTLLNGRFFRQFAEKLEQSWEDGVGIGRIILSGS